MGSRRSHPLPRSLHQPHPPGVTGPVLTGLGADAIFAGGRTLTNRIDSHDAVLELETAVRAEASRNFRRERYIPDFFDRVRAGAHLPLVSAFQTREAWKLSRHLAPPALWGQRDGITYDKYCLRLASDQLGVPADLVWTRKDPLQRSSGVVGALGRALREDLSAVPGALTYTDPRTDDADLVLARAALNYLAQ